MVTSGSLSRATITNVATNEKVDCKFNPKEYTFSKQNTWESATVMGQNVPKVEFSGGQAMTLQMELFFDTTDTGKDVRKEYTDKIWRLMMIDAKSKDKAHKGRPPLCEFSWGTVWSFRAVITSISQKFTMFLANGTPVRSTLNVTFQQAEEEGKYPGQNPTTQSRPGYRTRMVKQGETIDIIAFEEYGDPVHWRFLADANGLGDPMRLEVGQLLAIPPLP